ncbi:iron-containing redox enzyme family protein [Polyangium jinanense]|uniref:Iron-containing redox enzyme family protein n=1 Tax=Polyangium jinanense TaxID=2829994 RepID=A0A9X3X738_9BACT|nr:iron-containing redox enzyme family protein [Polyangium jinanense]MDC3959955.1 iron-containing redox enzyme family protein [Polyangium jinanense]MDC3983835.1 iron-containing redox enzyme family protein [Polyangium jinanense]
MHSTQSHFEFGSRRLTALARAVGIDDQIDAMRGIFRRMLGTWADAPIGEAPPWPSDASDDHTPYEFSVAVGGPSPELRILVERRADPPTLRSNLEAAAALHKELARDFNIRLDRLRQIEDLFFHPDAQGAFASWHAASFWPGRAPAFKIYLNLQAQGVARGAALAEATLNRLGFAGAWPVVAEHAMGRGPALDVPLYCSLDLSTRGDARVKLYFRHLQASLDDLERACGAARSSSPGHVAEFCATLAGDGPFMAKGPVSCLAFVEGDVERPSASTIYFPVGAYAPDDREARNRIATYASRHGLSVNALAGPLEAFAERPLDAGTGMQSYASLRWVDEPRVTVYLGPEAYRVEPPRTTVKAKPAPALEPATEVVRHYEATPATAHPFFERLRREPVDLERLWKLLANFRAAITLDFPQRLAALTARVEDDRIRCILAKQLNDELGNGDFSRAHRNLFEHMFAGIAATLSSAEITDELVRPGRDLGLELERLYVTADPYEGLGASLVVEIYGKHVDAFVADEFRRQRSVAPQTLEWLHLHEQLEVDHADESMELARLLPSSGSPLEAAWRGARAVANGSWRFFDGMYRRCF